MADVTSNLLKRNLGAAVVAVDGAASQTIDYSERADEKLVLHVVNGDAAACRIKVSTLGFGGSNADDLDVDIAAGEEASIGVLESMYFKDPATQKATFQILDQDNTAFSGTVTNVKLRLLELPKALTN